MSFFEKNAWQCLFALLITFSFYFFFAWKWPLLFPAGLLVGVVMVAMLWLVFRGILSATGSKLVFPRALPQRDERDQKIENWAAKISGVVLSTIVVVWCATFFLWVLVVSGLWSMSSEMTVFLTENPPPAPTIQAESILYAVQILFGGLVATNLVYYALVIAGYRKRPQNG